MAVSIHTSKGRNMEIKIEKITDDAMSDEDDMSVCPAGFPKNQRGNDDPVYGVMGTQGYVVERFATGELEFSSEGPMKP
jgi:hypothetical protein